MEVSRSEIEDQVDAEEQIDGQHKGAVAGGHVIGLDAKRESERNLKHREHDHEHDKRVPDEAEGAERVDDGRGVEAVNGPSKLVLLGNGDKDRHSDLGRSHVHELSDVGRGTCGPAAVESARRGYVTIFETVHGLTIHKVVAKRDKLK